jgi:formylglycine-generating enzyme required for sulfatase activity
VDSVLLSDLRAEVTGSTFVDGERFFCGNLSLVKADVGGVVGMFEMVGIPQDGSMKVPLTGGKVKWDKRKNAMVLTARAKAKDRSTGEAFSVTITALRDGDGLATQYAYQLTLKQPVKKNIKTTIANNEVSLVNPRYSARVEHFNFLQQDARGMRFSANYLRYNLPWGEEVSGTATQTRSVSKGRDGVVRSKRNYTFKFQGNRRAGNLSIKTNPAASAAPPPLPIASAKLSTFGVSIGVQDIQLHYQTPFPTPEIITITLPGGVPLVLVRIPAGSFVMGSPSTEWGRWSDEGPQTNVTLTRDFYMGKYEVTQRQWEAVMGAGNWPGTAPSATYGRGPNHPMYYVSWNDARNFIAALNAHITSTGQGPATMRLPTEAEWEYACRAGTTTRFYFGNSLGCADYDCSDCAAGTLPGNRSDYMWYCGFRNTHPVGQKLPNAFGLYDMHGNVLEWVQDWWNPSHPGGSVTDPTKPSSSSDHHVFRGGGWHYYAWACRSAFRSSPSPEYYGDPGDRLYSLGFRVLAAVQ